jgi:leucyl aminopeptidase (aminopeptidase T)
MRLSYMPEEQFMTYAQSLKDESSWLQPTAEKLRSLFTKTNRIKVECAGGSILTYHSKMETPVVNDGDYSKMKNVGGGYPIGEIFSEPVDLSTANGQVEVYAYPGEDHKMRFTPKPFLITIKDGCVEDGAFPREFQPLMEMMRRENPDGKIPVREFGLGLNRNITPQKRLTEASAFERIAGLHLSLGWKHGAYLKKFKKQKELVQRYHVDIYPAATRIWLNDTLIFENGQFVI